MELATQGSCQWCQFIEVSDILQQLGFSHDQLPIPMQGSSTSSDDSLMSIHKIIHKAYIQSTWVTP